LTGLFCIAHARDGCGGSLRGGDCYEIEAFYRVRCGRNARVLWHSGRRRVCTVGVTQAKAVPYVVTLQEVGSNVVATGSGEFNLTGLTPAGLFLAIDSTLAPFDAHIGTGLGGVRYALAFKVAARADR
jgi:hypothetical protein